MGMINHKFWRRNHTFVFLFRMKRSYEIYAVYFLLLIICITGFGYPLHALPAAGWLIVCLLARYYINHTFIRWNLLFYVTISAGWICYFIYYYGWETGATSFILPLMLVSMFSLYDTLFNKIAFTVFFIYYANGSVFPLPDSSSCICSYRNSYTDHTDFKYSCILRCHERDLYIFQFQSSESRTASDVV